MCTNKNGEVNIKQKRKSGRTRANRKMVKMITKIKEKNEENEKNNIG